MKTRTITRNKEDVNDDLKKSLEQWDAERDIIQEKIDKKKLLIEKNVELKKLIQSKYSELEQGTIKTVELEIKFLELDDRIQALKDFLKNYLFTFDYDFMERYKEANQKK
tara:strand:+ start:1367 stop:1696 length:330 start_codon:yes stop_codon:yes gene_type:complete